MPQRTLSLINFGDEQRIVISKDSDFFYSHLVLGRPWKLVLVKTGNMSTGELCSLFERHLSAIEAALEQHTLVEIDRAAVTPLFESLIRR